MIVLVGMNCKTSTRVVKDRYCGDPEWAKIINAPPMRNGVEILCIKL